MRRTRVQVHREGRRYRLGSTAGRLDRGGGSGSLQHPFRANRRVPLWYAFLLDRPAGFAPQQFNQLRTHWIDNG